MKGQIPDALKPWMKHLAAVKKAHPGIPYREVMKIASKSFTERKSGAAAPKKKPAARKQTKTATRKKTKTASKTRSA